VKIGVTAQILVDRPWQLVKNKVKFSKLKFETYFFFQRHYYFLVPVTATCLFELYVIIIKIRLMSMEGGGDNCLFILPKFGKDLILGVHSL